MESEDLYMVAGRDLDSFVKRWVDVLKSGGGESRGLLTMAIAESDYSYGATFLMANIASKATNPAATHEELLLFAVLDVYRLGGFPGASQTVWEGEDVHLRRAFSYFKEIGDQKAAQMLRQDVLQRTMREDPPAYKAFKRRRPTDPAEEAYWDREMASIDQRSFRAAKILDPDGDFDSELQAWE